MLFCSLTAGGTQAQLMVLALALESGKFISIWDWQWYKMLCGDIFLPSRQFEILRKRNRWNSQMLFWGQWFLESDYWVQYGESQADSWGAVSWPVWTHFCFFNFFWHFFPQRILWDKQRTTEYKGFCAVSSAKHLLASQSITSRPFCPLYWSPTETLCFALEIVFMLG